jgi:hypothetical protein
MSEVLDVALTVRKVEIERLSVTSSKPVNRGAILRKEAELDTPKIIIADSRE